jgi:hypothetical protein
VHGIIESVRSDRACTASIRSRGCCRGNGNMTAVRSDAINGATRQVLAGA